MGKWLVSLVLKIVEPGISLLDQLGLKDPIKNRLSKSWTWVMTGVGAFALMVWGGWLWLWEVTPTWAVPLLLIAAVGAFGTIVLWLTWLALRLIEQWYATRSRLTLDASKYKDIGNELVAFSDQVLEAVNNWEELHPTHFHPRDGSGFEEWDGIRRANEDAISRRFRTRFLTRSLYYIQTIEQLGIKRPAHLSDQSARDIVGLCRYLGLIGHFLKDDRIDDARNLSEQKLWSVIHR